MSHFAMSLFVVVVFFEEVGGAMNNESNWKRN